MKYTQGIYPLLSVKTLAKDIYDLTVKCPDIIGVPAKPGQFVHIRVDGFTLRRPISICETSKENGTMRLIFEVRGKGTEKMALLQTGDTIDILGPLGNGFELLPKGKRALIVTGGIGAPPLLSVAKHYGKDCAAILGFRSKTNVILEDDYAETGALTFVTTDDGSYEKRGLVTVMMRETLMVHRYDMVYVCGPKVMMEEAYKIAQEYKLPCQVSMEENMACGIGACLGCACKVKREGNDYFLHVCKDGPVFKAEEVFAQ